MTVTKLPDSTLRASAALRRPVSRPPRLALIGCGAIASAFHVRGLRRRPDILSQLVLVDPDTARARALARTMGLERVEASHRDLLDDLDGAIITAPHRLHYAIARECLEAGVNVLSEKPLAESAAQVRELARLASNGPRCAVNNTRRYTPAFALVRQLIQAGAIGAPRRITMREGDRYDWPVTGPVFGRASGGKGVLLDIGAHTLDLLCWWLGAKPAIVDYRDDSAGGSEAVADIVLAHGDCIANVRLSWLARQRNTYVIAGDEGRIEVGLYDFRSVDLVSATGVRRRMDAESRLSGFADLPYAVYDDFLRVVEQGVAPAIDARDVLPSIELIEECYARRRPFDTPWQQAWRRTGVEAAR